MSYDLMIFDSSKAPRDEKSFLEWYEVQTQWGEAHSYDDPSVSAEGLRNLFMELIKTFPQMNGKYAPSDEEVEDWEENDYEKYLCVTDYSIGKEVIYCGFSWKKESDAYELLKKLAKKYKVGFFNASSNAVEIEYND